MLAQQALIQDSHGHFRLITFDEPACLAFAAAIIKDGQYDDPIRVGEMEGWTPATDDAPLHHFRIVRLCDGGDVFECENEVEGRASLSRPELCHDCQRSAAAEEHYSNAPMRAYHERWR